MQKLKSKSIELIFATFARHFSQRFKAVHDDKYARQYWMQEISRNGITDDEIKFGIELSKKMEWPPGVGEFITNCKANRKPIFHKSLSPPKVNESLIRKNIDHMKRILR